MTMFFSKPTLITAMLLFVFMAMMPMMTNSASNSSTISISAPVGPVMSAMPAASEESFLAAATASGKLLHPPITGEWKSNPHPVLPPNVDINHMKNGGDAQRVLERFVALTAAWQLANTAKPPQCWHRKGGGTLQLPTGKVEEIQEAITLFWDGFTLRMKGVDAMKGVGFLGQIGQPHLSTAFGNPGLLRATYSNGQAVWLPIAQDDARCKWTLSLLEMFYNALRGEGNGFPPNLPPLLPQ